MTTMVRFQRVAQLWNWLPGFRGVAEHENIHRAAEVLAVSPSALSRTVKLLESALGAPLFVRESTGLALTPLGTELLGITRAAMRQVDDCIAREEARRGGDGPLFLGVTSEVGAAIVACTVGGLAAALVHVLQIEEEVVAEELLRGRVDLVVSHVTVTNAELLTTPLGDATSGIYGADPAADPQSSKFVATTFGSLPPREAACYCESLDVARRICESSHLLCVLPDVVRPPSLHRLADAGDRMPLYAVRRKPVSATRDEAQLVVLLERLRDVVAAAT